MTRSQGLTIRSPYRYVICICDTFVCCLQEYKTATVSLRPGDTDRWMFRGTDVLRQDTLSRCSSLKQLAQLVRRIPGVGPFLAQHLIWNLLLLETMRPILGLPRDLFDVCDYDFIELQEMISRQNTLECLGRFLDMSPEEFTAKKPRRQSLHQFQDVLGTKKLSCLSEKLNLAQRSWNLLQKEMPGFTSSVITATANDPSKTSISFSFEAERKALGFFEFLSNLCMLEKVVRASIQL